MATLLIGVLVYSLVSKKTYNIPPTAEVEIVNKNFLIKQSIFSNLVQQYISSTYFVLDINLINKNTTNLEANLTADFESQSSWPNKSQADVFQSLACEIKLNAEIRHLMKYNTLEIKDRTNIAKIIVSHILRENPNRRSY
ncbi:uncharacterized protein [Musca autumnalis]|uniref:uncharacterized protein n=1 Tax=Musca autumnalis TaxID=221902 RepID=UPI003CF13621